MPHEPQSDDVKAATRALTDAVSLLSQAVKQSVNEATTGVGAQLSRSLRDASRDLAEASVFIASSKGTQRRQAKAANTRQLLLSAARTLIATRGFEGASVGDIAAAAGFTKGAIYANFGDKEELLLALAEQLTEELACGTGTGGTPPPTSSATDEEVLERSLLLTEIVLYAVRHPERRDELAPLITAAGDHLCSQFESMNESPDTDVNLSRRDTSFALLTLQTSGYLLGFGMDNPDTTQSAQRVIAHILGR